MTNPVVAPPPTDATADTPAAIREALRRWYNAMFALWGRDITFLVTLAAGATSTPVTDARITGTTAILLQPATANAAAALATTYVSETGRVNGTVSITHANSAQVDRTFRVKLGGA
jgi:hypothetical protein